MRRIKFKDNGEEHNFWQNYTDLMSGFLIVFIIASLVAYNSYRGFVELYYGVGVTEANINDIVVNAKLYKQIKEFQEAQKQLQSKYFAYSPKYNRFECTVDVLFKPEDPTIPERNKAELIAAGKELEGIIRKFVTTTDVAFKVIIEGRAAQKVGTNPYLAHRNYAETLSYNRARNLKNLWLSNGILTNIESLHGEIFVSGSGYGGQGRHTHKTDKNSRDPEGLNKTFIIQIVPYITYNKK